MYQWMQNNGKYLMAVFGVLLMIVYILPAGAKYGSGHGSDVVRGKMGKVDIYQSDLTRYRNEWEYLNKFAYVQTIGGTGRIWIPIRYILSPTAFREIQDRDYINPPGPEDQQFVQALFQQFQDHPEMYTLLIEEARQMGIGVSRDQLETLLQKIHTTDDGENFIPLDQSTDSDRLQNLQGCLADFLMIQNAFARASSVIKTSQPLSEHNFANYQQQLTLDMVEFPADSYLSKVPAPTQAQMDEQFKKYADVDPSAASFHTNPFDFGYRYPNRIKVQYISLSHTTVFNAALKVRNQSDQTRYDWDVAAYRYYQSHQSLYPATQPVAGATTRPFKDVTDEARQAVLHDDADKLALSIRQRIISTMTGDYMIWKNAVNPPGQTAPATQPIAPPASSLGVPYDSGEYLTRLALMIQKNYGVLPTVVSTGDWQTAANVDSLAGISSTAIDDPDFRPISFGKYALTFYDQFLPTDQQQASIVLGLYQPSEPLKTDDNDFYLFRINAAEISHAPTNISEVAEQVKTDLRNQAAYQLAEADAQKFLVTAQAEKSISTAAKAAKLQLLESIPVHYDQSEPITGYSLLGPALREFSSNCFDLLSDASPTNPHPIGLVPVQVGARAIVAQLTNIQPLWRTSFPLPLVLSATSMEFQRDMRTTLYIKWFDYNDLVARTDYHAVNNNNKPAPEPQNSAPNPPLL